MSYNEREENIMKKIKCDFCGEMKTDYIRTKYGSSFGYIRLMCDECRANIERVGKTKVKDIDKE